MKHIWSFVAVGFILGGARLVSKIYYLELSVWSHWQWWVALVMWAIGLEIAYSLGKRSDDRD